MGLGYKIKIPVAAKVTNLKDNKRDCDHCSLSGLNNTNGLPCKDIACKKSGKYTNFKRLEE